MLITELFDLTEVKIDNQNGAGATPDNANIDYKGLRVLMRPSVFLKLAAPLNMPHSEKLEAYIAQGGAIASPMLIVDIPEAWEQGDFQPLAQVTDHEGRNRASVILKLEGDEPIEFDHDCREGICGQCGMMINGLAHGPLERTTTCQLHLRSFMKRISCCCCGDNFFKHGYVIFY